jgi:hypothetical protein
MIVYSAVSGGYDSLRSDHATAGAEFLAFVDDPAKCQPPWNPVRCYDGFKHPNLNAKTHKVLPHLWLPRWTECSLWLDANVILKVPAETLLRFLGDADVAMFAHPERSCIYDELAVSAFIPKYDANAMAAQVDGYREDGWPVNAGLMECGVILRRHTTATERFNEAWWAEICRHTFQDQLSVLVAAKRAGVRIATIPGSIRTGNEFVEYQSHQAT